MARPVKSDVERADAAEIDDGDDAAEDRPGDGAPDDGVDLEQVVPHDRVADREREEQHRQGDEVEREAEIEQVERDEAGDRDREGGDAAERGDLRALARRGGRRAQEGVGEAGDEDHPAGDQRHRVQAVDEEDRGERAMKGEVVGDADREAGAVQRRQHAGAPHRRALDREGEREMHEGHRPQRLQEQAQGAEPAGSEDVGGGDQIQPPGQARAPHGARRRRVGAEEVDDEAQQGEHRAHQQVVAERQQILARVEAHGGDGQGDVVAAGAERVAQGRADRLLLRGAIDGRGRRRRAVERDEARLVGDAGAVAGPVAIADRRHEAVVPQEESGERPPPPAQRAEGADDDDRRGDERQRPEASAACRPSRRHAKLFRRLAGAKEQPAACRWAA